jgi:hypothetical protein
VAGTFAITGVVATSPKPSGTPLGIGDTLTITLTTDAEVGSVTGGTPTLTLSNGATATYTGFDSTGLHFSYTVQSGLSEDTAGLQVTALLLNGATVDHDATISFAARSTHPSGGSPFTIATADIDGDGHADLVTADRSGSAYVMLGNGDGTFAAAVGYTVGTQPYWVTTADVNGDGKLDLITANYISDDVSVLLGNGDGTFAAAVNFLSGDQSVSVAAADIDGDGDVDLAVSNLLGN